MASSGLEPLLVETATFLAPLRRALRDTDRFAAFLARFGYELDPDTLDEGLDGLGDLAAALEDVFDALSEVLGDLPSPGSIEVSDLDPEDLAPLAEPIGVVVRHVTSIVDAGSALADTGIDAGFPAEVFDLLLHDHLERRAPIMLDVLRAFGVLETVALPADEPGGRDLDATLQRFRWTRLRTLLTGGGAWAEDAYGWGTGFDADLAITRIVAVLDHLGPYARLEPMTDEQLAAGLVTGHPAGEPRPLVARAPLLSTDPQVLDIDEVADGTTAFAEAGLLLLPFGDVSRAHELGLGLAPYAVGTLAPSTAVTEALTLLLDVDAAATGGGVIGVTPDGLRTEVAGDVAAAFELALRYARPDGEPVVLAGATDGTRVEIDAAVLALGGSMDGSSGSDLFVAGGFEALRVVLDLSGNGFLGSLVAAPVTLDVGDVLAGWRSGRGIYLEGGTGLAVLIPLDIDLGPLHLEEAGLELELGDPVSVALTVTASAALGPLFAYVEGLGLRVAFVDAPGGDGVLGRLDLAFSLVPPTGYAIALDAEPIVGGGMLAQTDDGYRGALALDLGAIGFSAFAVLTTDDPDGRVPFSFVASIFGEFSLPLGFGFFLTGLGGIIGMHRTVDTDAMREALYDGRLDDQLFPADPIANADSILDDMEALFPVERGQHVFGPVARIAWGQPALLEGKLGVVVEVGDDVRVLILGSVSSMLPTRDTALVELHLAFFGEIDFAAETIEFDATLANSRVLIFGISGEMALRTGWGTGLDHVVSFGGLHPDYPKPDTLPDLQRLTIAFGKDNPKVSLRAYLGVTLNSLQFGARLTVYFKGPKVTFVGRLAVEGTIYFDALLTFNPFAFDVMLGGSLELLVDGDPKLSVGFDLRLRGPNRFMIDGKAWARVFGIKVSVPISHRWGDEETLPAVVADPARVLLDALADSDGFQSLGSTARNSGVTFAQPDASADGGQPRPADPAGGLRLSQRAVPLATPIEKVGEADVADGPATFDVRLSDPDGLAVQDHVLEFARGQFYALTEAERLRTPSFDRMKAGIDIAPDELRVDPGAAIEATHDYEVIVIERDEADTGGGRIVLLPEFPEMFVDRFVGAGIAAVAAPHVRRPAAAIDALTLREVGRSGQVAAGVVTGLVEAPEARPGVVADAGAGAFHGQPAHANYVVAAAAAAGGVR